MLPSPPEVPEPGGPGAGPPAIRASDADREQVVQVLRSACAEGRITLDEFSDRVGEAYAARTVDELKAVTADLPVPVAGATPATPSSPAVPYPPGVPARRKATRWVLGILGGGTAPRGRWRAGEETVAVAVMGGCHLDLRQAEIEGPEVEIKAYAVMGGVEIVVPEGIEVDMNVIAIMGGRDCKLKNVPPRPGTPIVRVRGFAFWGGVEVRSKPPLEEERARREARRQARAHEMPRPNLDINHHIQRHEERIQRTMDRWERRYGRLGDSDIGDLVRSIMESVTGGGRQGPGQSVPAAPDGTVTLMFTDIEGFTAMTERLGDLRAQAVLRDHNALIRAQVTECGGHEVKALGDSFMVAFTSASRGLRCAAAIQRSFAGYAEAHPDAPVRVRIGLHTGEAIREDDDLFGRTVIVASRIADAAEGGEVLVSSLLMQLTESSGEFVFDEGREIELKGLSNPYVVHALKWEGVG
jgi:class 3 adenylate cyclase